MCKKFIVSITKVKFGCYTLFQLIFLSDDNLLTFQTHLFIIEISNTLTILFIHQLLKFFNELPDMQAVYQSMMYMNRYGHGTSSIIFGYFAE